MHLVGFGVLVGFAAFLVFAAKRYYSVYAWAHQPNRRISPEPFHSAAINCNSAILLVMFVVMFFTVRSQYKPGMLMGIAAILTCLALFVHGCGYVAVRH